MNPTHEKTLINFKKARSHIDKILQMLEGGKYCVDIMQQNLAVIGLLKSAQNQLMEGHLNSCFLSAMNAGSEKKKREMVNEILTVTRFANR